MNLGGGEIGSTVQRQQVMTVQVDEAFQRFAALQTAEDVPEQRGQILGIDRIEDGPHLRVAGNAVDAIDRAEVIVGVLATLVEGQQGRVLQRKHGKARHQGVAQGDGRLLRTRVGEVVKPLMDKSKE